MSASFWRAFTSVESRPSTRSRESAVVWSTSVEPGIGGGPAFFRVAWIATHSTTIAAKLPNTIHSVAEVGSTLRGRGRKRAGRRIGGIGPPAGASRGASGAAAAGGSGCWGMAAGTALADRRVARGLEKFAPGVRAARADGNPVVLIDAGDCTQGSPLETFHQLGAPPRPDPMMAAMTAIGFDAMVVGNHEFDFGPGPMASARASAGFPWLCANLRAANGSLAFAPSLIKTVGGIRVGIVGVTTPITAAWLDSTRIGGLRFEPPVDAARAEVTRLRDKERCDLGILVAHTGLERDPATGEPRPGELDGENWAWRLANEVKGIDALVIGHTHVVIPEQTIGGTLVAQAGAGGDGLGGLAFSLHRRSPSQASAG